VIACRSLTKTFGRHLAVDRLSFEACPGKVTGFLGRNGAGKTTTLRILLGLARATSGSALIDGHAYADLRDPIGSVGAVLEESTFHPGRTAHVHLTALALAAGIPLVRVAEVLRMVELTADADMRVGHYSLGMRQRLSLAAALLGKPSALILDEPANGLDPQGIRWLRTFLRARASEGSAVLLSSHMLSEVSELVDEVVIIGHGRLVHAGSLHEMTAGGARLEDAYFELTGSAPEAR
jgi:ABC-2 type transport system ATP-binding protein